MAADAIRSELTDVEGGSVTRVALAGFVALLLSGAPLVTYTQSLFLEPMTVEFGWTKTQYFVPLAISGAAAALFVPWIGRAADRFGLRRILLPAICLFGITYAAIGMIGPSLLQYGLLLMAATIFQGAHGVLLYAKAVSLWPARRPALMFAVTLSGSAAGGMIVPPIAARLIAEFGWRDARFALGALVLLVALPVAWAFVRAPNLSSSGSGSRVEGVLFGVPLKLAARTRAFWAVMLTVGLSGAAINAMVANLVPVLAGNGMSAGLAALGLSVIAGTQLVGRIISGMLMDHFATPRIAIPMLVSPLLGVILIALHLPTGFTLAAVALLGLGLGSEMEMAAYFTRRYFGTVSFAEIYGCVLMVYVIGANVGPLLLGSTMDLTGSATGALVVAGLLLLPALIAVCTLPGYTYGDTTPT